MQKLFLKKNLQIAMVPSRSLVPSEVNGIFSYKAALFLSVLLVVTMHFSSQLLLIDAIFINFFYIKSTV